MAAALHSSSRGSALAHLSAWLSKGDQEISELLAYSTSISLSLPLYLFLSLACLLIIAASQTRCRSSSIRSATRRQPSTCVTSCDVL